jgi:hypothetical protein
MDKYRKSRVFVASARIQWLCAVTAPLDGPEPLDGPRRSTGGDAMEADAFERERPRVNGRAGEHAR